MAFIKASDYAQKHKVTLQNVLMKVRKGWFKPEEIFYSTLFDRYAIVETAEWPMHKPGHPKKGEVK